MRESISKSFSLCSSPKGSPVNTLISGLASCCLTICLGKGELQDRQVVDLYVDQNGNIGKTQYYTGIQEVTEIYENTSSESDELEEKGREKLQELMNFTSFSMDVEALKLEIEIGDIIGGRDYVTGMYAAKPIAKKIYKMSGGTASLEYEIEGDES